MGTYSIKDLEQLSGIKAHTIRIWEQRYNFLDPERTETNIRLYNDEHLKLILNVAYLKDKGFKISKILDLPKDQLKQQVLILAGKDMPFQDQLHALTLCMLEMDEKRFEKVLSNNLLLYGLEKTILNIIYPFLNKIGILWQSGSINPCHEHFISNLVRQKLIVAIDGLPEGNRGKKVLLYLPEGELHELGLLFGAYLFKSKGYRIIYLGQTVPFDDLKIAHEMHKPDYVFSISTTYPVTDEFSDYLKKVGDLFSPVKVMLSGPLTEKNVNELPDTIKFIADPESLIHLSENGFEGF